MIRIAIGREDLELSPSTSIEWVRVNPLFTEDVSIQVDRSFNFKIPCTPNNMRILDDCTTVDEAVLYVEGRLFMNATLHVLDIAVDSISVSLVANVYTLDLNTKITALDYVTTPVALGRDAKDFANAAGLAGSDYVFPFIKNIDPTAIKAINGYKHLGNDGELINQDLLDSANVRVDVLSPQFSLLKTLQNVVAQSSALRLTGDFLKELDTLLIYNNTILNDDAVNFIFEAREVGNGIEFTIPSRDTFDIGVGDVVRMEVNGVNNIGTGNFTTKSAELTIISSDIDTDGKVNVQNFLTRWGTELVTPPGGVTTLSPFNGYYFDFAADEPYLFIGPASITGYGDLHYANIDKSGAALYSDINAANHLPDITAGDFLKGIKDFFNLSIVPNYSTRELVVVNRNDVLQTAKYKDYTSKVLDESTIGLDDAIDYRFVYANDPADVLANDPEYRNHANNHPEHVALGYEDKTINAATTNVTEILPVLDRYPTPYVVHPVRRVADDYDASTLRIIDYEGFKEPSTKYGPVYIADTDGLNPNEAFNAYWRAWYSLFKNGVKTYKVPMMLSSEDILGIDPQVKWKIIHHNYLWKEIHTTISMRHGIETSMVHVVKVQYADDTVNETNETEVEGE